MIKPFSALLTLVFATGLGAPAAFAQLQTRIVASGLDHPLFATSPAGDSRLFIVEQGGFDQNPPEWGCAANTIS